MEIQKRKQELRKQIALLKRSHSKESLLESSQEIMRRLENTDLFANASCIALYHALEGEVQTAEFIRRWSGEKRLYLPVVDGDNLRLVAYEGPESLKAGVFGILEPVITDSLIEENMDLIIVPGLAFDRHRNRMGRGKGYYDRLLSCRPVPRIGICFDFQLVDSVPIEPSDEKMDLVITEKEVI